MLEVPRVNTPVSLGALPSLIEAGFRALGRPISALQRLNLTVLVALETARGKSVQNGNLGNISAGASYGGPVWRPPWFDDETNPLHAAMLAGRAPSAFRAYDSHEAGALDFAKLLNGSAYASLMSAADTTSADAFRRALAERYSPDYANPRHTESIASLQRELGLSSATYATPVLLGLALAVYFALRRVRAARRH